VPPRKASGPGASDARGARRSSDRLGSRSSSAEAKPTRPTWQAVYDGQRCIGHLLSRGRLGVEAFDADDRSLGIFPTTQEAAAAIPAKEAAS